MKKQSYYNKVHLVPFAEYIPLSGHFPKLKSLNFGQGNFRPGTEFTVFYIDSIPFSNMICYESSMPNIARAFVKSGAQLLTIEANDGYLGNTTGPYQHFELARLRAIENRVPIVRSANTGISGLILPNGLVEEKIKLGEQSVFLAQVNIGNGGSIYSKIGDIFAIVCFMFLLLIGFQTWRKYS
jgi:apolipoprotein N-acyltransferase